MVGRDWSNPVVLPVGRGRLRAAQAYMVRQLVDGMWCFCSLPILWVNSVKDLDPLQSTICAYCKALQVFQGR